MNRGTVEEFRIGYAPAEGKACKKFLQSRGYSEQELMDAGLLNRFGGDMFRGRMMVPFVDTSGVIGFTARVLDKSEPKYLNTSDTLLFNKSRVVFVLALLYTTCAVQVFFRDLAHIISIVLQFLQWGTPILWSIAMVPERLKFFVRLNPMVYIVTGYRESVYDGKWFFEHPVGTIGFWLATLVLFYIGARVFKRCKPHYADVL